MAAGSKCMSEGDTTTVSGCQEDTRGPSRNSAVLRKQPSHTPLAAHAGDRCMAPTAAAAGEDPVPFPGLEGTARYRGTSRQNKDVTSTYNRLSKGHRG